MSSRLPLKKGYVLKGYSLGEVLGGGGFSLVYLASQELSRKNFVIKEPISSLHFSLVKRSGAFKPRFFLAQSAIST